MAERASLNQIVQLGVEVTPGTGVAVTKRLNATSIEPGVQLTTDQFRPAGSKYKTVSTLSKEWVQAAISGRLSYSDLVYLLSSVGTTAVITPVGASGRKWSFSPSSLVDDVPKTFTVEHGSSVRADSFTYGLITELGININREANETSGSMIGHALTDGIVLTGGTTEVPEQLILPTDVSVFMDPTFGALGTTKLTRLFSAEWNLGSRFGPVWVVDAANPGFVGHVETEPDFSLNLTVEADTQGMSFLTQVREGQTKFIRIKAIGPEFEVGQNFDLTMDMACKVENVGSFTDNDGVYAIEINLIGVHDAGYGKAWAASVTNTLAAL